MFGTSGYLQPLPLLKETMPTANLLHMRGPPESPCEEEISIINLFLFDNFDV